MILRIQDTFDRRDDTKIIMAALICVSSMQSELAYSSYYIHL